MLLGRHRVGFRSAVRARALSMAGALAALVGCGGGEVAPAAAPGASSSAASLASASAAPEGTAAPLAPTAAPEASASASPSATAAPTSAATPTESYVTRRCTCGGVEPKKQCLYRSKGDSLDKLKAEDQSGKPCPPNAGCRMPILYAYCD